jgi:hypothetical protein
MISLFNLESNGKELSFTVYPASLVVFRITVKSKLIAPAVIQPKMEDWVMENGKILKVSHNISPLYYYLAPNTEMRLTITFTIPADVKPGNKLFGSLRFPGAEQEAVKIYLIAGKAKNVAEQVQEFDFTIQLPLRKYEDDGKGASFSESKHSIKILAGMAGLELLPAKWLVSELILLTCEKGLMYSHTHEGKALLEKLSKTKFYKNGVLIFRVTQLPHWTLMGATLSSGINAVLGNKTKESRLLNNWEEWLLNLVDNDIESPDYKMIDINFPRQHSFESITAELGAEAERWFSLFLLGLTQFSPRLNAVVQQVCAKVPNAKKKNSTVKKKRKTKPVLNEKGSLQR